MGGTKTPHTGNVPWSYSSLSLFKLCPKKYYHERVIKDIPFEETEALRYGNAVHEAIENYIKGGEFDPRYDQFKDIVDSICGGSPVSEACVLAEVKFGFTKEFEHCDFFSPEVWFRGKIDLLITEGTQAWLIDWKTGKNARYADMAELELFSIATFLQMGEIQTINAAFLYLVTGDFISRVYTRDGMSDLLMKHLPEVDRLEKAHALNVWNPSPNFTCRGYCRVQSCPHNSK